jgi:hypothetical protein
MGSAGAVVALARFASESGAGLDAAFTVGARDAAAAEGGGYELDEWWIWDSDVVRSMWWVLVVVVLAVEGGGLALLRSEEWRAVDGREA